MLFINPAAIGALKSTFVSGQFDVCRRNWREFDNSGQQYMNLVSRSGESVTLFLHRLPAGEKLKIGCGFGLRTILNEQNGDFYQQNLRQSYFALGVGFAPAERFTVGVSIAAVNISQPREYAYNDSTIENYSASGVVNSISVNAYPLSFVTLGAGLTHTMISKADLIHEDPFGHLLLFENPPTTYFLSAALEPYPNLTFFGTLKGYYESALTGKYYSISAGGIAGGEFDFDPELSIGAEFALIPQLIHIDDLKVILRGGMQNKTLSLTHPDVPLENPGDYRQFFHAGIGFEFAEKIKLDMAMAVSPYKQIIEDTVRDASFRESPLNWKCSFSWILGK